MNIALIAPSPVPFVVGGAENLWWGIQRYINEYTKDHCELFKIPTREGSLLEILQSYLAFSKLNFDSYDLVISTKYPAWMVNHHNHIVYMQHTLRGLYDTYHFCKEPIECPPHPVELDYIFKKITFIENSSSVSQEELINFIESLCEVLPKIEVNYIRFPGPFSRKIVHFLDAIALKPSRIKKYFAISNTVKKRENYFPKHVNVEVLYHPAKYDTYSCASYDYIFTASRLDNSKRISLLIEAMKISKTNMKLHIAGKGPEEKYLRELSAGDERIIFDGYLTDKELNKAYSESYFVVFVPYDEDYGLITVEAMKSSKAVLTVSDSGGVCEIVSNNETGVICNPNPEDLARGIDYLCEHKDRTISMGKAAKKSISFISWSSVVTAFISDSNFNPRNSIALKKKKMVVAVTFPIFPPRGGGQARIFNLYKEFTNIYDVIIVSLSNEDDYFDDFISNGLREIRIPKSRSHQHEETELSRLVDWVPITDLVANKLIEHTVDFVETLKFECRDADVVVASHPYFIKSLLNFKGGADLWYEAHNVEYDLKKQMLPDCETSNLLLDDVWEMEALAWRNSDVVFACSKDDLNLLENRYKCSPTICVEVPNGYSPDEVKLVGGVVRKEIKHRLGLAEKPMALFMGSWHNPNIESVNLILEFAPSIPDVLFLIAGSVGLYFKNHIIPPNVVLLGVLDEVEKNLILGSVDVALNPMISGSGSNLKMFDYFASGIPVITTEFGARAISIKSGVHYISSSIEFFPQAIVDFFTKYSKSDIEEMVKLSADLVQVNYSWLSISQDFLKYISKNDY